MARYLVTGGAGFIGSHIAAALSSSGHSVRVLDDLSTGKAANLAGIKAELQEGSIIDERALDRAMEGMERVYHEAALVSVAQSLKDPDGTMLLNAEGTRLVLEAAVRHGVEKVVIASSAAVYGTAEPPLSEAMAPAPISPYGESKVMAEKFASDYLRKHGLRTVSLRYFNVYGPRQDAGSEYSGVIARFIDVMLSGHAPKVYGDGSQTRDFIYVGDVVRANLLAMESAKADGKALNIATGHGTSINELLSVLSKLTGRAVKPEHLPGRQGDIKHSYADISMAKKLLGFGPRSTLSAGLKATVEWRKLISSS